MRVRIKGWLQRKFADHFCPMLGSLRTELESANTIIAAQESIIKGQRQKIYDLCAELPRRDRSGRFCKPQ